jgi:Family of unknown function (DUF5947)
MTKAVGPPVNARPFGRLQNLARRTRVVERCDLCGQEVAAVHEHLIDPATLHLSCACTACAILFASQKSAGFRRIPDRVRFLEDFDLTDAKWDALLIPIDLAFFFHGSVENRTRSFYPGPAGVTESLLPLDTWDEIVQANPRLATMQPDVEALLVHRARRSLGNGPAEYFILPIDECYRLAGVIRANWKGLSGGTDVWREIAAFFEQLKKRAARRGTDA